MRLTIEVDLFYRLSEPADVLLQIEAADLADQRVISTKMDIPGAAKPTRIPGEDGLGERIWLQADGDFRCDYRAEVEVERPRLDIAPLDADPPHRLRGDAVRYLMPSRYCPSDQFPAFTAAQFGELRGGARIAAIRDWVEQALDYVPGSSTGETTAVETFVHRQGICRDYAHLVISLARASAIPARFASVYAPGVKPQDFHAVAEVYLDGTWHLVDATGMAPAETIVRIGVGSDAAEVPFLSVFGPMTLVEQSVSVVPTD